MSVLAQIRRKYRHFGLRSLLDTSPESVALYLTLSHLLGTIDREELLTIAGEENCVRFGTDEVVTIADEPGNPVPEPFEPIAGQYRLEEPFVCELTDCALVGSPTPVGVSRDGRVVLETAKNNDVEARNRIGQQVESDGWVDGVSKFDVSTGGDEAFDVIFPMAKQPDFSYYHWLTEYVPKLRGLKRYEEATGREPMVLLEPDPPTWVTEYLQLAGVPERRWVEWDHDVARVNRLVVATHREKSRGEFFNPSTDDYRWLRDRIRPRAVADGDSDDEVSDRVYVSRRHTDDRRVVNEPAVVDALSEVGFVSYELETMSVPEQIRLFAGADIIVGGHGAGLTNVVFADESATLVDLINENHLSPGPHLAYYYFAIAHQVGVGYEYLACAPDGRDMIVDTETLLEVIEEL